MKKRILSILLAVMMIVPMLAMPISATEGASSVPNNYSYKFDNTDARNYVEGQVIDFGEESATAPAMNGDLAAYDKTQTFSTAAGATLPVYYAIKDGYLYVAVKTTDTEQVWVQFDVGVQQYSSSDMINSRVSLPWKADNTLGGMAPHIKFPQQGVEGTKYADHPDGNWADNSSKGGFGYAAMQTNNFISDYKFTNGIYEVKIKIAAVYRYFAYTVRAEGIYETPCMSLFFWHTEPAPTTDDPDKTEARSYYAGHISNSITIGGSTCTTKVFPATIILPEKTLDDVNAQRGTIGELGTDWRNAVENQLVEVNSYATVAPEVNGSVDGDSYTTVHKLEGASVSDVTVYTSVTEDGYVYVAVTMPVNTASNQFAIGLANNTPTLNGAARFTDNIKADGTVSINNSNTKIRRPYKNSDENLFGGVTALNTMESDMNPIVDLKRTNGTTYTTLEAKVFLAPMIACYADAGWDIEDINGLNLMIYNGSKFITFALTKELQATITKNSVTYISPTSTDYANVYPVIKLPEGCIQRFVIDDMTDLGAYGQNHVTVVGNAANVTLDGIISEGEYAAAADATTPYFEEKGINIVNYFNTDDDYIYVATKVVDPYYTATGSISYQNYQIAVFNNDGKVDVSDGNKRMNGSTLHRVGGTTYTGAPGLVWRFQADEATYKAENNKILAEFQAKYTTEQFITANSTYDEATKTVIYEYKFTKSALRLVFGLEEDEPIETFTFFNTYYTDNRSWTGHTWYAGSESTKQSTWLDAKLYTTLQYMTRANFAGELVYYDTYVHNTVVHFVDDVATMDSASARISLENAGLRFKTVYSNAYLAEMAALAASKGETMQVGTLIAPADFVGSGKFTHAALGEGNYIEVMGDITKPFASNTGTTTIAGSIVNIKKANLNRQFAGIGFIKIGDQYFYADTYCIRSISSVANAALNDTWAAQIPGYQNMVSEGVYSPYSEAKREILSALVK